MSSPPFYAPGMEPAGWPRGKSDAEAIEIFTKGHVAGKYLTIACMMLFVYEYVITFELEVEHIWYSKPKMSLAKGLFYLNRYFPLVSYVPRLVVQLWHNPSAKLCWVSHSFASYSGLINVATVEIVLVFRIWVLFERRKNVAWALFALTCVAFGAAIAVVSTTLPVIQTTIPPAGEVITGCFWTWPEHYWALFIIALISESFLFILTVIKSWRFAFGTERVPLIVSMLHHGTFYFGAVLLTLLLTIITTVAGTSIQAAMASDFTVPFTSIACTRLILSLRSLNTTPGNTELPTKFTTNLVFERPVVHSTAFTTTTDGEQLELSSSGGRTTLK